MQLQGEQLLFLVQVLKDSLEIQMGYDWPFTHRRDQRKSFYENLINSALSQEQINIVEKE